MQAQTSTVELTRAESTEWANYLYDFSNTSNGQSLAQGKYFFVSSTETKSELELSRQLVEKELAAGIQAEDSFSCRFPARSKFILRVFYNNAVLNMEKCIGYQNFRDHMHADSISLIFADYNPRIPSSAFGHVFLKLNSTDSGKKNELLSLIVDYGADPTGHSLQGYFVGSILGVTQGKFSSDEFHRKIRLYNESENRDLWEYHINFTPQERDVLSDVLFEQGENYFDYFFFSKNCAFYIGALLQATRPRLEIVDKMNYWVLPIDLVKILVAKNAIDQISYRPSLYTTVTRNFKRMSPTQRKHLIVLMKSSQLFYDANLSSKENIQVFDTLVDYYTFLDLHHSLSSEENEYFQKIIFQRSLFSPTPAAIPFEKTNEDMPHRFFSGSRLQIRSQSVRSYGEESDTYLSLGYRPTLHHFDDPDGGLDESKNVEFLNFSLMSKLEPNSKPFLERFDLFNLAQFTPINIFNSISSSASISYIDSSLNDFDYFHGVEGKGALGYTYEKFQDSCPI